MFIIILFLMSFHGKYENPVCLIYRYYTPDWLTVKAWHNERLWKLYHSRYTVASMIVKAGHSEWLCELFHSRSQLCNLCQGVFILINILAKFFERFSCRLLYYLGNVYSFIQEFYHLLEVLFLKATRCQCWGSYSNQTQ